MAPRRSHRSLRPQVLLPDAAHLSTGPYLMRSLRVVERHLHVLYSRQQRDYDKQRLATIVAASDPRAPIWEELLQLTYLENAREGLLTTLQALRQPHGRAQ